jgi:hypothetical protein
MTDPSPILSYRSPNADTATWKLARLFFLANALIFLSVGLAGTAISAAIDIVEIRTPRLPSQLSSADIFTVYLVCSLGITLVGVLFLYSFAKLRSNIPLAVTLVRRCAFGIMPTLIAIVVVIIIVQADALLHRERPPDLAVNILALGICTAGLTLLGYTAWIAGRIRNEAAQHRPPTV